MSNQSEMLHTKIEGKGTFTLPPGMTPEEAERLVREADRNQGKQDS